MQNQMDNSDFTEEQIMQMIVGSFAGMTIADLTNLDPKVLEGIYNIAHNFYYARDFEKAMTLFNFLCIYNHKEYKYLMGMAACQQATEKYKDAIDNYALAGLASTLKNPIPFYHASQCYLKLGDKENAVSSLKALSIMGDENNLEHTKCKQKAEQLLMALEKIETE